MCVVAVALGGHARWRLLLAGNRDEHHARASAPLARWTDAPHVLGGRDLVAGGSWLGVSELGRLAVVTNVNTGTPPDPGHASRGALVTHLLTASSAIAAIDSVDPVGFNPFNLLCIDADAGRLLSNRPVARRSFTRGIEVLSNGVLDTPWPKTAQLAAALGGWLADDRDDAEHLFAALRNETPPAAHASPLFIRGDRFGTRCSTVVAVDADGKGTIHERRYHADGSIAGDSALSFRWPGG
jgi:uncharacterized protein with NRDE domain